MCRCFALSTPIETLRALHGFEGGVPYPPRPVIVPGEPIGIIRRKPGIEASALREFALVRWGLVPHWVKDIATFGTLINARAETILDKASFKTPMRHRRCVVPADNWTVWTGKSTRKVPYHLYATESRPLAFAALWDHWLGADGSEIETAAIITVAAADAVAPYDDRMPVLLDADAIDAWLDVRGIDSADASRLLTPSAINLIAAPIPRT